MSKLSALVEIHAKVPPEHIEKALKSQDAIHMALELGRLDLFSGLLAAIAIILAVGGVIGAGFLNWKAHAIAKAETRRVVPESVSEVLLGDRGPEIIRNALKDPSVLASVQAAILELGIGNAAEAAAVDTDAQHPETTR
jgi:hypothetical protein